MKSIYLALILGCSTLTPSLLHAQTEASEVILQPVLEEVTIKESGFFKKKFTIGNYHTNKVGGVSKTERYYTGIFSDYKSTMKSKFKFDMVNDQNDYALAKCFTTRKIQNLPIRRFRIPIATVEDVFGGEILINNQNKWYFEVFNLKAVNGAPVKGYMALESNPAEQIMIEPIMGEMLKGSVRFVKGLSFHYRGEIVGQVDLMLNKMFYKKDSPAHIQMLLANMAVAFAQSKN